MDYNQTLDHARDIMEHATKLATNISNSKDFKFPVEVEDLRWFLSPNESRLLLLEGKKIKMKQKLFSPLTTSSTTHMQSPGSTSITLNISSVSEMTIKTFNRNISWIPQKGISEKHKLKEKSSKEMNDESLEERRKRTILDELDSEGDSLMQMIHQHLGKLYATPNGRMLIENASKGNSVMKKRLNRLEKERRLFESMALDDNYKTTEEIDLFRKVSVIENFGDIISEVSDEITMKYPFSIKYDLMDTLKKMVMNIVEGDVKCSIEHAQISVKLGLRNMISEVFEREQKQIDQKNRRLLLNLVGK